MKLDSAETLTPLKAEIVDRGRGPEIKGTRITVYAIMDYVLLCWHPARIAARLRLSTDQVEAALEYINEHTIEVLKEYVKILERSARGNPPEFQAKLDASHAKFQDLVRQVREAQAHGETDIQGLIGRVRAKQAAGDNNARNHGGQ